MPANNIIDIRLEPPLLSINAPIIAIKGNIIGIIKNIVFLVSKCGILNVKLLVFLLFFLAITQNVIRKISNPISMGHVVNGLSVICRSGRVQFKISPINIIKEMDRPTL
jgi:hypothetical protein